MRLSHIVRSRIRSLFLPGSREADLREELQGHIDREAERLRTKGLAPDAARLEALRTFGGIEHTKDACRDTRGTGFIDALARDVRHGIRRLARDWPFSVAGVLILGLGIGVNTASFSAINAFLFRKSMFADPARLVEIYQRATNDGVDASSYPAYLDMATYTDIFESTMTAAVPGPVTYQDGGAVRRGVAEHATPSYLTTLGLRPALGRWFETAEDTPAAELVAVVGHRTWIRKFGGDPSIVGRTLRINGLPVRIVGVGPKGHNGTINIGLVTDFWMPIAAITAMGGPPRALERRPVEAPFLVTARLRDGVTVARAQAAMDALGTRLAREYPKDDPGKGIRVMASRDVRIHPQLDGPLVAVSSALIVIVGLVLAIACSNLATLLLVRGTARAKEVSIRLALGASRGQLVRHLLTESVLLSIAGGAAGCLLAWWGLRLLNTVQLPVDVDFGLDYRVLAFAIVLSFMTGVTMGLAPALRATRIDLVPTLRDESGAGSRDHRWFTLKNGLIVLQVAISVVLLSATGVFVQLVLAARAQPVGYAVDGVAMLETDARYAGYAPGDAARLYDELRRRVAVIPGVESTTSIAGEPMQVTGLPVLMEGSDTDDRSRVIATSIWAAPGFFETLRIPILFGRALDERDRPGTPRTAVISESMARLHFGSVNAVGRRFRIAQDPNWIEVVGIARDTKTADLQGDLVDPNPSIFYRSSTQFGRPPSTIVARTSLDATSLVAGMQRELRAIDPSLPVLQVKTMAQHVEDSLTVPAAVATFLGVLGTLGASLAGIGLYAVVAFAVSRRAREIGIRMALGARGPQVVWNVAKEVLMLVGVGTGVGLVLSAVVTLLLRGTSSSTPGVYVFHPRIDPLSQAAIVGFMAAVGLAAAWLPARRAAKMDPLVALRHD